ncbi:hypothetical protein [endosymbiont GvMRE of Glomus versiforme]|uniref:hypothetical protein n=1 Tax=endosymbiont GvMRE of Glomus versiforme TaxID=2039283 RepID=UPI000EDFA92C|nr:hypothetical protein [endosymbiont GvMRE of Glomus versiforme]RHZ36871.1 hypothetical protein GvMRE_I2g118 [endosymbiont GvMRE of Glomus versiforme]
MTTIKFKLLTQNSTNQGLELSVSECSYNSQTIHKITLKGYYKLLSEKDNKWLIIKNIQNNEIEFKPNNNELVIINSSHLVIFSAKTDFLFAVSKIEEANNNWEIELSFPHAWNGEKVTKIQFSDIDNQYKGIIEENKNKYFFVISGIKKYDLLSATNEAKILLINDFQDLEKSTPFQPGLIEILVKNLEKKGNYYLIKCQEDLAKIGLKDYKKIRIIASEKINYGDIIQFNLTNLKDILQRDEEEGILKIDNNYHGFTKIKTGFAVSPQEQARIAVQKQSQKFLKKYQNEYKERVNWCQKSLEKYFSFLQQLNDKLSDQASQELMDQKNFLSRKLAEFANENQLEAKISLLERKVFSTMTDYQNQGKIDQFKEELANIDQEFKEIIEKVEKYQNSFREYLKEKLVSIYENDSKLQQLLSKHNVNQQGFFANLNWNENYPWLQENGTINYLGLEKYLQEQSLQDGLPNNLGYFPNDLKENSQYKPWYEAQIKKSEAENAINLGYSIEQWRDPQYQEYKDKNRILADGIIEIFQKTWTPLLLEGHKKDIKDSRDSGSLVDNILSVQEKRFLNQAKDYFKDFIDQELKKSPVININELGAYSDYVREIDKRDWKDFSNLEYYIERITNKINQIRENKISSLTEAREQTKKNLNETFKKTKIKLQELHQQYQNWETKLEKMESITKIFQFGQELTLLVEKINCLSHQKWFPNFGKRERGQIKSIKDEKKLLETQIKSRKEKKKNWLITHQINKYLRYCQELQEAKEQDYFIQKQQLEEVRYLLNKIGQPFLNSEQIELQKTLQKIVEPMSNLYQVRGFQRAFNKATSVEDKKHWLQQLQRELQGITKIRKLTEQEAQIQKKVEQNFRLIQQGKETEKFSLINEKQTELELLTLEEEENDSVSESVDEGQDWISQKTLVIFAVVGFLLILLFRWYRKKKEEDPFR